MIHAPSLITKTADTPHAHALGYSYGKAAFQHGKPRTVRHDDIFAAFLRTNQISLTALINQAWTRGWDNAREAAALRVKIAAANSLGRGVSHPR